MFVNDISKERDFQTQFTTLRPTPPNSEKLTRFYRNKSDITVDARFKKVRIFQRRKRLSPNTMM